MYQTKGYLGGTTHNVPDTFDGRIGSLRWYLNRARQLLYDRSRITVMQCVYLLLMLRFLYIATDRTIDMMFCLLATIILPPENLLPPSLYLARKMVGMEDLSAYEYHVCHNDCYVWAKIPKEEWPEHYDEKCPFCQNNRFASVHGVPSPSKVSRQ